MRLTSPEQLYNQIRALQEQLGEAVVEIKGVKETVTSLNNQVQTQVNTGSPIVNDIRDSDWNYSTLAYTGSGANDEAAHWYKHFQIRITDVETMAGAPDLSSESGFFTTAVFGYGTVRAVLYGAKSDGSTISTTLTRVDDNNVAMAVNADIDATGLEMWFGTELDESPTQALETSAISQAKWDKDSSTALIGGASTDDRFSIDQPLLGNPCTPSSRQYFQVLAQLAAALKTEDLSIYIGVWDATAGQQRWLEGENFDLAAAKVGAHTGGATTYTFRIIATTDYGYQLQSDDATVTNAVNPLTSESYIALEWTNLVGINRYDIYMYDGTDYFLVYQIGNGSYTYFVESSGARQDASWPTITATKWRALVLIPPSEFSPTSDGWVVPRATLLVPNTYNQQNTTGKQWLRMGLTKNTNDLVIRLDHVALCTAPGTAWVRSRLDDDAVSAPDGNASSGTQGGTGGGGGAINPPGTGGGACIWEGEPVLCEQGEVYWPELSVGMMSDDGFGNLTPIVHIERAHSPSTAIVTMSDGSSIRCSLSHPFIQRKDDYTGRTAFKLAVGDSALTSDVTHDLQTPHVVSITSGGAGWVLKITKDKSHPRFVAGKGARKGVFHNVKPNQE